MLVLGREKFTCIVWLFERAPSSVLRPGAPNGVLEVFRVFSIDFHWLWGPKQLERPGPSIASWSPMCRAPQGLWCPVKHFRSRSHSVGRRYDPFLRVGTADPFPRCWFLWCPLVQQAFDVTTVDHSILIGRVETQPTVHWDGIAIPVQYRQ